MEENAVMNFLVRFNKYLYSNDIDFAEKIDFNGTSTRLGLFYA